jgi:hypothetical protein
MPAPPYKLAPSARCADCGCTWSWHQKWVMSTPIGHETEAGYCSCIEYRTSKKPPIYEVQHPLRVGGRMLPVRQDEWHDEGTRTFTLTEKASSVIDHFVDTGVLIPDAHVVEIKLRQWYVVTYRDRPTFYLDANVQGILHTKGARMVAAAVLNIQPDDPGLSVEPV